MDKITVNKVLENYYEDCKLRKKLNDKTMKAYQIDMKQYLEYVNYQIDDYHVINDYIHYLNKTYDKVKTVKRKLASIKAFYTYLEYQEIIEVTPFRRIRTEIKEPKILPKVIPAYLMNEIFTYLYTDIKDSKNDYQYKLSIRNAAIIELLFATGIRISELCHIKKDDIDIDERVIKIFGKGSKERMIYLGNNEVIDLLIKYRQFNQNENSEYFFTNKYHERLSEQAVRIYINNLGMRLSKPIHLTPHMFRHTFATTLLDKDVDIRHIQKILGHSSISITQIYTHVSNIKQKEILLTKNPRNDYIKIDF